jgi:hypothetical protein
MGDVKDDKNTFAVICISQAGIKSNGSRLGYYTV